MEYFFTILIPYTSTFNEFQPLKNSLIINLYIGDDYVTSRVPCRWLKNDLFCDLQKPAVQRRSHFTRLMKKLYLDNVDVMEKFLPEIIKNEVRNLVYLIVMVVTQLNQ